MKFVNYLKLYIIIFGFVLFSLGLVMLFYRSVFRKNCELREGMVKDLKHMTSSNDILLCPIVEYNINGRLVKAHCFTHVMKNQIDFKIGDIITILVNPKHPSVFMLENYDFKRTKGYFTAISALGAVLLTVGIVMLLVF